MSHGGAGERAYRRLVRLFLPGTVRDDAERELIEVFRDLRAREAGRGFTSRSALWARLLADLAWTALVERTDTGGEGMMGTAMRRAWAAARSVVRRPRERLLEGLTLMLGVAAGVVALVLVRDVLLRPLPYERHEDLVRLVELDENGRTWWPSRLNFEEWRAAAGFAEGLVAATVPEPRPVLQGERALRADVARFSAGFFRVLGASLQRGRAPAPDEEGPGGPPVAVVSHRFWLHGLGGPPLEGLSVLLGTEAFQVVGVLAPGFGFLGDGGGWSTPDVWIPLERDPERGQRQSHGIHVVARFPPGTPLTRADAELDRVASRVAAEAGEPTHAHAVATTSLAEDLLGPARRPLRLLLVAATAVLAVAALNLAGARLVHGLGRARELAVRRALGAGRGVLVVELLAEALAMAVPAALVGTALARSGLGLAQRLDPAALPRLADVGLDPAVAVGAFGLAVVLAGVAAVGPAVFVSGERAAPGVARSGRGGVSRRLRLVWDGVLALQVALTLALLMGSGVMIRNLLATLGQDVGYRAEGVLVAGVSLPASRYGSVEERRRWADDALARVRGLPGVTRASLTDVLPHVTQARISGTTTPDGPDDGTWIWTGYRIVDPAYFAVLGIPHLAGDALPRTPGGGLLVDRTVAERLLAGREPVGGRVRSGLIGEVMPVAGVVGPVREWAVEAGRIGTLYVDYRAAPDLPGDLHLLLRGTGDRLPDPAAVRAALTDLDGLVPLEVRSLASHVAGSLGSRRLVLAVTATFAALGLLLAAVGIYGVVAFVARRRLREAGVRVALGARPAQVSRSILGIGIRPALAGVVGGLALSLLLGRVLEGLAGEAGVFDAAVAGVAASLVLVAAAGAGLLPARRAGRADPASVLREE